MPATLVDVVIATPVFLLVNSTFAPVMTAPAPSVTMPETVPRLICAVPPTARINSETTSINDLDKDFIAIPYFVYWETSLSGDGPENLYSNSEESVCLKAVTTVNATRLASAMPQPIRGSVPDSSPSFGTENFYSWLALPLFHSCFAEMRFVDGICIYCA